MTTEQDIRWPVIEDSPNPYIVRGVSLPSNLRESLDRYARYGVPPGDFLKAVLSNNLLMAVGRADDDNLAALPAIVGYVYNALPSTCWGSAEAILSHVAKWFPLSQAALKTGSEVPA